MKFTFSLLKDYLETDISLDEVATNLTEIGLEVEEITNPKEDLKDFNISDNDIRDKMKEFNEKAKTDFI